MRKNFTFDDAGIIIVRKRLRSQMEETIKCNVNVTCLGPLPNRCGDDNSHNLKIPLRMAIQCLYCGFWFCRKCARIHFGETGKICENTH